MKIEDLNQLIKQVTGYDLPDFDTDGLASIRLKDGSLLNFFASEATLMLFMQVEVLGEEAENNPVIFRNLLHSNVITGRFNNMRITYDEDTTVVWLCHDVTYDTLTAQSLTEEIKYFEKNAPELITILREDIINIYTESTENTEEIEKTRKESEELTATNLMNFIRV